MSLVEMYIMGMKKTINKIKVESVDTVDRRI